MKIGTLPTLPTFFDVCDEYRQRWQSAVIPEEKGEESADSHPRLAWGGEWWDSNEGNEGKAIAYGQDAVRTVSAARRESFIPNSFFHFVMLVVRPRTRGRRWSARGWFVIRRPGWLAVVVTVAEAVLLPLSG